MSDDSPLLRDRLLEELADVARAQQAERDSAEALARGDIDAAEARARGLSEAEIDACEPLDEVFRAELSRKLVATARPANTGQARVIRPRAWLAGSAGVAVALAAGILLTLQPGPVEPLPRYQARFSGGEMDVRSTAQQRAVPRLTPETRIDWVLQPEVDLATGETIEVRCFIDSEPDGEPANLRDWPERSAV